MEFRILHPLNLSPPWQRRIFLCLFLALSIATLYKTITIGIDVPIYLTASEDLKAERFNIYSSSRLPGGGHYTAGPIAAILWMPLNLSLAQLKWVWGILNGILFIGLWWIAESLWTQSDWGSSPVRKISWIQRILTLLMLVDVVSLNGIQGNWTVFLLFLCASAPWFQLKSLDFLGGFLSSLAFCIKPIYGFPLLYLMARRSWHGILGWCVGSLFFGCLLPILVLGSRGFVATIQDWLATLLSVAPDPYCKFNNQSALCVGNHLFGAHTTGSRVFAGSFLLFYGLYFLWAARSKNNFLLWTSVIFLHLTCSGLVHDHYYVADLFPLLLLNGLFLYAPLTLGEKIGWWVRLILVQCIVIGTVGREWSMLALNYGQHLWGTVIASLVLLSWESRMRRQTPAVDLHRQTPVTLVTHPL